jgi:hypothetical protein
LLFSISLNWTWTTTNQIDYLIMLPPESLKMSDKIANTIGGVIGVLLFVVYWLFMGHMLPHA